jgi:hypothetical protein
VPDLGRRDFAATLAVALGLGHVPTVEAADEPTLSDAAFDALIARCGKHLDEADRKALRGRLRGASVGGLARLLKLDWRDEPASVYFPETE